MSTGSSTRTTARTRSPRGSTRSRCATAVRSRAMRPGCSRRSTARSSRRAAHAGSALNWSGSKRWRAGSPVRRSPSRTRWSAATAFAPGVCPRMTSRRLTERWTRSCPGDGSLAERYQAWREGNPLEIERLAPLLGLPEGERAELDYVSDEPWTAFNYYLGGLRSRVAFNMDVPMAASLVTGLIAHEIYPGHHTEHAWKEQRVVRERGYLEESINLVGTPQGLVSEGIAGLAPEIVVDDEDALTAEHLARLGIAYDADLNRSVRRAARPLDGVSVNAAQLIHEEGAPTEDVREYLRRWGLRSERRAELNLRFIADPVWRSYITTYTDGYYLCRDFVGDDPARYRRLLTEQLTPADLELQARV